jgi:hypothetical protein
MPTKKESASLAESSTIDLDQLFRADSKARKVAERLLTGGEVSRQDLSAEFKVAVTTINRVVEALEGAGATVRRDLNGRRATFQVTAIGPPRKERPYPMLGSKANIMRAEMIGTEVVVDFVSEGFRYRGTVTHLRKGAMPLGLNATVVSVNLESDETATVTLEPSNGSRLTLGHTVSVTV